VEGNLDWMEQIGIKQLHKNIEFADYYKMIREMVLSDWLSDKTQEFISLVNEVQLPSNVRHYDWNDCEPNRRRVWQNSRIVML
jgi:hypothetical protein